MWVVRLEFIVELFEGSTRRAGGRWDLPRGAAGAADLPGAARLRRDRAGTGDRRARTGQTLLAAVAFTVALAVFTSRAWKQGLRR
ncbi:MAG TPA: hypothetical protein VFA46_14370 [Actinomycetes bacterium]|nr:hypothetical protein [Actinomycetes bacterium]